MIKLDNNDKMIDEITSNVYVIQYELKTEHSFLGRESLPYVKWGVPEDIYEKYKQSNKLGGTSTDIITMMEQVTMDYVQHKLHDTDIRCVGCFACRLKDGVVEYVVKFQYVHEEKRDFISNI